MSYRKERDNRVDVFGFILSRLGSWTFVRAFGELTILTRASITTLIFVPVLAAIWPTARGVFESVSLTLPSIWAVAFLASLSALIGNVLYQVFAPTVVKQYSLDDYVHQEVSRYNENPIREKFRHALTFLGSEDTEIDFGGGHNVRVELAVRNFEAGNEEDRLSKVNHIMALYAERVYLLQSRGSVFALLASIPRTMAG
ncbi:hypothetical protein [Ruegeria sp. HKCCA5763]|uniref:hypothetical protein n=1 Tax=Ruegeria sp. HKCCA5763 TaxID=2682987 RepID=UPI0014897929|nr:hypothetical protein [Ruegeria sp. HKCCA5763]